MEDNAAALKDLLDRYDALLVSLQSGGLITNKYAKSCESLAKNARAELGAIKRMLRGDGGYIILSTELASRLEGELALAKRKLQEIGSEL